MSPVFDEQGIQLWLGDCREVQPLLDCVDAVVTDPPYGIGFVKGSGGRGKHHRRHITPILGDEVDFDPAPWLDYSTVVLFGADHFAQRLPHGSWFIWDKLDGLESFDSFADVEIAWCNKRVANRMFRNLWKGICRDSTEENNSLHISQKPVTLMAWCMKMAKLPVTSIVLDPFMGSGTTGIACIRTGRKFIGIEKDPKHFQTAIDRIRRELAQGQLFTPSAPVHEQAALI